MKIKVPGFSIFSVRWYDTTQHITVAKVHDLPTHWTKKEDAKREARNLNRRFKYKDPKTTKHAYVHPIFVYR